jgi:hypothetical protein
MKNNDFIFYFLKTTNEKKKIKTIFIFNFLKKIIFFSLF